MGLAKASPPSLFTYETHICSVSILSRAHLIEEFLEQRALPEMVEQFYVLLVLIKQLTLFARGR